MEPNDLLIMASSSEDGLVFLAFFERQGDMVKTGCSLYVINLEGSCLPDQVGPFHPRRTVSKRVY
jgi:hypothetical protein